MTHAFAEINPSEVKGFAALINSFCTAVLLVFSIHPIEGSEKLFSKDAMLCR